MFANSFPMNGLHVTISYGKEMRNEKLRNVYSAEFHWRDQMNDVGKESITVGMQKTITENKIAAGTPKEKTAWEI
jgi:hypothetical protein